MQSSPEKDLSVRSGSNLDSFPVLIEQIQSATKQQKKPIADAYRKLLRSKQSVLNKSALKKISAIVENEKRQYDLEVLSAHGNAEKIDKLKQAVRKKIRKSLLKAVPDSQKILALNKAHLKEYKKISRLLGDIFDDSILANLDIAISDAIDYETFEPPFEVFGIYSDAGLVNMPSLPPEIDQYITFNGSFVIPSWGVMANDFTFEHDHSSWLGPGFNYKGSDYMQRENIAVLGIKYKMPKTGFLNVAAIIQNMSNSITLSITDNFGFSKAEIGAVHRLYIIIVRPPGSALFDFYYRETLHISANSDGDDLSYSNSNLETAVPYTLNFRTPEMFNQGDELSILIGTDVFVDSYLEFMKSKIDTTQVWHLKTMYVSVS